MKKLFQYKKNRLTYKHKTIRINKLFNIPQKVNNIILNMKKRSHKINFKNCKDKNNVKKCAQKQLLKNKYKKNKVILRKNNLFKKKLIK